MQLEGVHVDLQNCEKCIGTDSEQTLSAPAGSQGSLYPLTPLTVSLASFSAHQKLQF